MLGPSEHVLDHLEAYLHGALSPADAAALERHCEGCRDCRIARDRREVGMKATAKVPVEESSWLLIEEVPTEAGRGRRRGLPFFRTFWAVAAGVAALLGVIQRSYDGLSPSPYDLKVLGQSEWLADADASVHVRLLDLDGGRALAGVPVEIELIGKRPGQAALLARVATGAGGEAHPRLHVPDWDDGDYELRVRAQGGREPEVIARTVQLKRSWRVMLNTDKPSYQPGQAIRMRGLALRRPDSRPIGGREVVFSVVDPKGNVIFRRQDVTSRYGIASADCPLAEEVVEGTYQVRCRVGDSEDGAAVAVKKYVLPKFRVAVELDRPTYQPGEKVRGTVRAGYFFGKAVTGGAVTIEARSTGAAKEPGRRLETRTDEAGVAAFELDPMDAPAAVAPGSAEAGIAIAVTVRDAAGQEQSATITRSAAADPIRVEVIPEAGSLVREVANTVYVYAHYEDGRPARARLAISGIPGELRTDELGVAAAAIIPNGDRVAWTVRATDDAGLVGRREAVMECGEFGGDFLVRADRAVYDAGAPLRLFALGAGTEPVLIDVIRDGQAVVAGAIVMAEGRGTLQLRLPADLDGAVTLCATRDAPAGLPIRKTRAIFVRGAHGLDIRVRADRAEYSPGGVARLDLALSDGGKPTPGAISLAAVDEAVFVGSGRSPGAGRAAVAPGQDLLEPIRTVCDWPMEAKAQAPPNARNRFEQALFALTARAPADRNVSLKAAMKDFLDGDDSVLRVLDRPDWEELVGHLRLPEDVLAVLRNRGGSETLSASSYPAKVRRIKAIQRAAQGYLGVAWTLLGLAVGIVAFAWICSKMKPTIVEGLVVIMIIMVLIALMLPAVQSAREAARRSVAINNLKQIERALAAYRDAHGKLPGGEDGEAAVHTRRWFPETLLWRPEVITDDQGRAIVDVDLADSITTWRLTADAVSGRGRLGATQTTLRVFQPFFVDLDLPVALTRGDEVAVPVVVHNHLDRPQTVELRLDDAPWFDRLDDAARRVELAAREVRAIHYRLRAKAVGKSRLRVSARGGDVADAIERTIEVVPDGHRVERVASGTLVHPATVELEVPDNAISGSVKALVRIYPSTFSRVVEGLDAIFEQPFGCFEQTSSTTYPNVLALDYLRRTRQAAPAVEAKARGYIHLGYQRLLSFEVAGGGFDWFGHPPANRTLTAYGLMEFQDMVRVHDVDPALIGRTRHWLLEQQHADGSWDPEDHQLHEDPTGVGGRNSLARLGTTAYIGWAAFAGHAGDPHARATRDYLLARAPGSLDDPYVLALVCNCLLAVDPDGGSARPYLDRLVVLKRTAKGGEHAWWESPDGRRTLFTGAGRCGSIEATALAGLALVASGRDPATARGALTWLAGQTDGRGTWHSTQATVLALKALLAGTGTPLGGDRPRRIELALDGAVDREIAIPADQADVMVQVDLSDRVTRGRHTLTLADRGGAAAGYQVVLRHHEPAAAVGRGGPGPLTIGLAYDRTTVAEGEAVIATATIGNDRPEPAPMVVVELPIPAGFAAEPDDLERLAAAGTIAKYQVAPRAVVVYLRGLGPNGRVVLRHRLRASMPAEVAVPPARAYEYYDPDRQAASPAARLTVTARE